MCYFVNHYIFLRGTKVRRFAVLAAAGVVVALLIPAHAQEFTYGGSVGGQVRTTLVYGSNSSWCLVDNGNTQFQIDQSNANAVISFAEVIYFDGSTYYSLDGQARMTFSSAAGGTMHFKRTIPSPGPVYNAAFTDFTQTLGVFNPPTDELIVTFNIVFPNCTLPIYAVYDAP
jgi:hypothetical protein